MFKHAPLFDEMNTTLELTTMFEDDEQAVYKFALESCQKFTKSKIGYFHFLTEDQKTLSLFMYSDNTRSFCTAPGPGTHYPVEEAGWWADTVRERKTLIHNNTSKLSKNWPKGHVDIKRHMSVPVFQEGSVIAVIGMGNKKKRYTDIDVRIVETFINIAWNVVSRKKAEKEVISLREIIPICSNCKKIKDDEQYWERVEDYISAHINVNFSHGLCEECSKELYGEYLNE